MLAEDVRLVREKASQPQWDTVLRYAVATTDTALPDHRRRLPGLCDEVASAFAEVTGRNRYDRHRLHHPAHALDDRRFRRGDLLSVPELAAVAHRPHDRDTPGMERAGARAVPSRPRVPTVGKVLGGSDAGVARPVALSVPDARHHVQVIGRTGSGKSTLLAHMILADVTAGRGVLVIDPKDDLVDDAHRHRVTQHISDKTLRGFWTWYEQQSEPARAHAIAPLPNKLRALLLRPFVATTLCAAASTVNLAGVLDRGGTCPVRVPKGSLGPDTAALLGSLVLAKTWEAGHRACPPRPGRSCRCRPVYRRVSELRLRRRRPSAPDRLRDAAARARVAALAVACSWCGCQV